MTRALMVGTMVLASYAGAPNLLSVGAAALAASNQAAQGPTSETSADEEDFRLVESLPTRVDAVATGATWCSGKTLGRFRIIVLAGGFEEVYHNLFVQLIKADAERHELEVIKTVPIKETLGLSLVVQEITLRADGKGLCTGALIEGRAIRRLADGERLERIQVRVTSKGEYKIDFQPENEETQE